eukprot:1274681-Karenia_brevis.AAC.1
MELHWLDPCCEQRHAIYLPSIFELPGYVVCGLPSLNTLIDAFWEGGTLVRWHSPGGHHDDPHQHPEDQKL